MHEPDDLDAVLAAPIDVALFDGSNLADGDVELLLGWLRGQVDGVPVVIIDGLRARQAVDALTRVEHAAFETVAPADVDAAIERAVTQGLECARAQDPIVSLARETERRAAALVHACAAAMIGSSFVLESWLAVVYVRDWSKAAHLRRVADTALQISSFLNVTEATRRETYHAALLHDIGQVAIPEQLVRRSEPLTPDEVDLVRGYVRVGYDVAVASPFLAPVADALFAIRERWDGSGYPRGLRGADIPVAARIVTVAETCDLLSATSDLSGSQLSDVAAALVAGAGVTYDPDVVRAFLRCADAGLVSATRSDRFDLS